MKHGHQASHPSSSTVQRIIIDRPDDWHVHLRDEDALATTVPHTARTFGRAIVMPNLKPPVTSLELAAAYRERIIAARPEDSDFDPLMTLYLTDNLSPNEIASAYDSGVVQAVKYYPAGATTNSDSGVTSMDKVMPALRRMAEIGMPLLIHGEVTDEHVDVFDREKQFIDTLLAPLCEELPTLRIVLEHITTGDAVKFVEQASSNVAATITAHHLLLNRNHLLAGAVRPHFYCLPILKRNTHQEQLLKAATSGSSKFFLGTDSAPHARPAKETSCGCAGIYSAPAALELYAEIFEAAGALDKLEGFASHFGADFYGLPRHSDKVTLEKREWTLPNAYPYDGNVLIPLRAGEAVSWRVIES